MAKTTKKRPASRRRPDDVDALRRVAALERIAASLEQLTGLVEYWHNAARQAIAIAMKK